MSDSNIYWHNFLVTRSEREIRNKQKSCVLWFTGLSGSGKSTLANLVDRKLFELNYYSYVLDGDNIRFGLNSDLSFSKQDRCENIRRIGEVVKLFIDSGQIVLTAFISPFMKERQKVRDLVGSDSFIEVYVDTPLNICETRDPKGLYKKARLGLIKEFTGVDSLYEPPLSPDIHIDNVKFTAELNADKIIEYLTINKYIK